MPTTAKISTPLKDQVKSALVEIIPVPHWSYAEMREAFGWTLEPYLFYGAYPGAAPLIAEPERWRRYIVDALIETTVSRDILLMTRVDKPALLRRLFQLGCDYSAQILSYQKMLGQLHDAGNTVTLAHYLRLLQGAGMVAGLPKYAHGQVRQRGSSPKLQVMNTALMTAQLGLSFDEVRQDGDLWGRLVESAAGAHLLNTSLGGSLDEPKRSLLTAADTAPDKQTRRQNKADEGE